VVSDFWRVTTGSTLQIDLTDLRWMRNIQSFQYVRLLRGQLGAL